MFGKLLKYDFLHYFKLWVIGAVTALVMSFVGGFCINRVTYLYQNEQTLLFILFILAIIISIVSIIVFTVLSAVLVCMRYAKNCYSDEGYLTFTLPAKRSTIYNSKFLNAVIYDIMTYAVLIVCIFTLLTIGGNDFLTNFFDLAGKAIHMAVESLGAYFVPYLVMGIILLAACLLFNISILYFCITLAGTKVKKNKVLAGIGIYYLITIIISTIGQLSTYVLGCIAEARLTSIEQFSHPAVLMILAIVTVWLLGATAALYYYQLHLLDKKLNLA